MSQVSVNPDLFRQKTQNLPYWVAYAFIASAILIINLLTDPLYYADIDTYIQYTNALVYFPPDSWMYFEVFSNIYLLTTYWLTQSDVSGTILAHYLLSLGFLVGLRLVFPPDKSSWAALLFTCAMIGPLLAFVTIRATPAYFLIAIATHLAINRRRSTWVFLVVATMFHISALLAAVPLALLYFDQNLPKLFRAGRSRKLYFFIILVAAIFGAALPQLSLSVADLVRTIPIIAKYVVYIVAATEETNIEHYVFFAFVASMAIIFMLAQTAQSAKLTSYVMISFILYAIIFFTASPIAAFRQTPFWMIPMISVLPWEKIGMNRATAPLFILLCVGLFAFQFQQVYA
ncbi:EpsG family protein [uncultured Parasphingorhabdus sp.]|uniref:EpsG family protein n=1 Tax=uncultured Parasphingorhabdus sp. TaxID=2709694 RepID=UPI0030D6F05D|tara:strand:+ start:137597 stop:138631 length:1035 start_codon:yes stop_codon:yes gene_type:complete